MTCRWCRGSGRIEGFSTWYDCGECGKGSGTESGVSIGDRVGITSTFVAMHPQDYWAETLGVTGRLVEIVHDDHAVYVVQLDHPWSPTNVPAGPRAPWSMVPAAAVERIDQ